jgi:outer membrane protein TolC
MAERDAVRAQLELYRWMGRSDFTAVNLSASLEERVDVPVPEISQAIEGSPQIRVAQQMAERARANTRLQRADGKPDPEAIAGYKRNVGADTAYLALQIDLPFHNRNQGNIASAIAGEHVAEADLREADLTVRTNIELARQSYLADQKLAEEMPKTVERANEAERLSRAAYREGALELLRLLDAERNRIEVQSEYYRALNELHQAAIRLRWASGQPLPGEK